MASDSALIIAAIARAVRLSTRHAWVVIAVFLIAAALAGVYVSRHIAINTNSGKLLSSSLPWRQQEIKLNRLFPQRTDLIVAVIDATTPEAADEAADALVKALAAATDVVRAVSRPDGGEFFARNGVLFLSVDDVQRNMDAADQGGAVPGHARRRSDAARDPRRRVAVARGRASRKNDARRSEAGACLDRRRPGAGRAGPASGLSPGAGCSRAARPSRRIFGGSSTSRPFSTTAISSPGARRRRPSGRRSPNWA